MKKIVALALVLVTLAISLVACGGKEIIGLVPKYAGEPIEVMDKNHEFAAEDFTVWVIYEKNQGQEVTKDFTFEVVSTTDEYYIVEITHKNWTEPCFVWIGEEETVEE